MRKILDFIKRIFSNFFCLLIRFYQVFISPMFPACCRYYPTCSQYGLEAFRKYGPVKGMMLTSRRIMRCTPYHKGGYDPVP